ncbi:CAP domain-containing protein [Nocardiopsis sp. NPDC050513]|uniref:CAP domain-containing protein n=1 Tax=Nocardiopsis sp. NPDC050513 TaxID=3364338 RepID=UPI00379D0ABD
MARGRRGRRRASAHGRGSGRGGRRRPLPLVAGLAAVPVGLTLAGTLLVTDLGDQINPLSSSGGAPTAGQIGDAVADDSAVPATVTDDDFFETPTATPREGRTDSSEPATARATASDAPADDTDADSGRSESGGGSGDSGSGGGSGGDGGGGGSTPETPLSGPEVDQVVQLVNAERAEAGCGPLRVDDRLTAAAQEHSEDMDARNYMAHQSPEGEGPGDRAERHGYDSWGAENVAKGQTSPEQVMDAWMNSPGHRANILNCDLVAIGVGESGNAWTQLFGWV